MKLDNDVFLDELLKMYTNEEKKSNISIIMKTCTETIKIDNPNINCPKPKLESIDERQNLCLIRASTKTRKISTLVDIININRFLSRSTIIFQIVYQILL